MKLLVAAVSLVWWSTMCFGDGPKDNDQKNVRRVPKLGIEVSQVDRQQIEEGLRRLRVFIDRIQKINDETKTALLPDVMIFERAVADGLKYQEFFAQSDVTKAHELLGVGLRRAFELQFGNPSWTTQTGLVVRGFVSRLDHTVQPYGLVVPKSYKSDGIHQHRLDLWFHGRGETLSEVKFLDQRMKQIGQYAPRDAFVLHPYGRYSNAFKFAGEVDVLEALEAVQRNYRIDPDRIAVRGFSMGGAACWQFAVHYTDRWFAANPGAGFSETPEFLKSFQKETLKPTWYERKLWHMYDCTDYAVNLFHCPTVAYSGEVDRQKQAADIMASYLKREGIVLQHIIGPKTGHRIHPDSKVVIEQRMKNIARHGRNRMPKQIHFVTYTLKYNRMHWITIDGLAQHWKRARVDARIGIQNSLSIDTQNVTELTVSMPAGSCAFDIIQPILLNIDDQDLKVGPAKSDRSWQQRLFLIDGKWTKSAKQPLLRKRHNLQGPIDDAFMDSFIVVRPTGQSTHPQVVKWAKSELEHFVEHWRRHFRGDARVKDDTAIDQKDIAASNLILFGDPLNNQIMQRVIEQLPVSWGPKEIVVANDRYDASNHALIAIYPNPLNPNRYVVFNSGFTFREYDYLNNARQVPKLPDWAIVDLRTPADSRGPGKIVAADFFTESWRLAKAKNR